LPYVSARIILRLARISSPNLESWWHTEPGIAKRTRVTRWLTGGLALVQSFGFATFVQNVPGVVEQPGIGFLVKTMALLTASSIGVMLLSEALLKSPEDDEVPAHDEPPREKLPGEPVETASIEAVPAAALLSPGEDAPLFTQSRERVEARSLHNGDDGGRR
jgi:hypothetical protein